jgi:hypothetical protein
MTSWITLEYLITVIALVGFAHPPELADRYGRLFRDRPEGDEWSMAPRQPNPRNLTGGRPHGNGQKVRRAWTVTTSGGALVLQFARRPIDSHHRRSRTGTNSNHVRHSGGDLSFYTTQAMVALEDRAAFEQNAIASRCLHPKRLGSTSQFNSSNLTGLILSATHMASDELFPHLARMRGRDARSLVMRGSGEG